LRLSADDKSAVLEALERVGLGGKGRRLPRELSGGERQRVALARVLVRDRPALLLDEPFGSLGPALRDEMLDLLFALHREQGMTILFVTHQPEDAHKIADAVVFLENGTIAAKGDAREFFGEHAPDAFRRYLGDDAPTSLQLRRNARKPT
jgi:thiamine transport system ATP-binding protein